MINIEVKNIFGDYGVYKDDKLIHIFIDRCNAELVKKIFEFDLKHKIYNKKFLNDKNSNFEIRLFNHKNNKVIYDNLSEYQINAIAEILNQDWEDI